MSQPSRLFRQRSRQRAPKAFPRLPTGDVVVSVEGDGGNTGSYTDNQAAPLTLYEYGSNGSGFVGSFVLPQTIRAAISPFPANMAPRRKEPCNSPAMAAT